MRCELRPKEHGAIGRAQGGAVEQKLANRLLGGTARDEVYDSGHR